MSAGGWVIRDKDDHLTCLGTAKVRGRVETLPSGDTLYLGHVEYASGCKHE
jgi:hypothetical protein